MGKELLCYNRGCQKTFDPEENFDDSCCFHPGEPVFHDAYKSWSCCNKKSTDFTTFLAMPGCHRAKHSNEKPPETVSVKPKPVIPDSIEKPREPMYKPKERPPADAERQPLSSEVSNSLVKVLEELKPQNQDAAEEVVRVGSVCHNGGCKASFTGTDTDNEESCVYHDGTPVFHEGMKYWTCCNRKTSDFNAFLEQVGCMTGKHAWTKPKTLANAQERCRSQFINTADFATLVLYAKNPVPAESFFKVNQVSLDFSVTYGGGKVFAECHELFGIIDSAQSSVKYFPTKVEVVLKKAEPISWPRLTLA